MEGKKTVLRNNMALGILLYALLQDLLVSSSLPVRLLFLEKFYLKQLALDMPSVCLHANSNVIKLR